MADIRSEVNGPAERLGIEIIEVRIRRADYPDATRESIYHPMKSERESEASEIRAQGPEQAQKIRVGAEKQRVPIGAEERTQIGRRSVWDRVGQVCRIKCAAAQ